MMGIIRSVTIFSLLCQSIASPLASRALLSAPTVTVSYATIVGTSTSGIDSFMGIPFAQPPTGQNRLRPPQSITANLKTIQATASPKACPALTANVNDEVADYLSPAIASAIGTLPNQLTQQATNINADEDCLTVNVMRPAGTVPSANLPVLFWIYGGGFEQGSNGEHDSSNLIKASLTQGKPIIYVAVNYRLNAFGFLAGKEVFEAGVSNLGLLDQRMGLHWVADNIASFGGDPSKVTIWGESAGSISVFDQLVLFGGNNTYKGSSLFRAAIMDSGSILPADPVDCPRAQKVYDTVVSSAGCGTASDSLQCLRDVDYDTFLESSNSVPSDFSYHSVAISYLPRPDGQILPKSPELLISSIPDIPLIIGDQEDEGSVTALFSPNITTTEELVTYLNSIFFQTASHDQIADFVNTYPDDPSYGSPFRTGVLYNYYPQYKRLSAIVGDYLLTLSRRAFLERLYGAKPSSRVWSYLATYLYGNPVGTFHSSDLLFAYGTLPGFATTSTQTYYINFISDQNPNGNQQLTYWPSYDNGKTMLSLNVLNNTLISDTFRKVNGNWISQNITALYQ